MLDEKQSLALGVVRKTLSGSAVDYSDDAALMQADIDTLDIDSLGKLEMVMELEKKFGFMLNETDVASCKRVGDLVSLVVRTVEQPG